ncbi:hypothetical protein [Konateibacter massiliensis]|uniref:hypothetical protein n=1 Tax=Konateibacter massiliensis TaxID=2002841 RepID=UPI000C14495F|nr:hypothetical protein [Konateibacter massiliensis]
MPYVTRVESSGRSQRPKLVQQICSNFKAGDIAITLGYVASGEEASGADRIAQFDEFIRNLRKNYRAARKELKYVAVPVYNLYTSSKIDRVELIVNGLGNEIITLERVAEPVIKQSCWNYGKSRICSVQSHEHLKEIAEYMESQRTGRYHISKDIAKAGR